MTTPTRWTLVALGVTCLVGMSGAAEAAPDPDKGDLVVIDAGTTQLTLLGMLQTQMALLTGDDNLIQDGDAAEQIGGRLRRARIGLRGWAYGVMDYALSLEGAGETAHILDAWIAYRHFAMANVILGIRKVPFSRFALTSSSRITLAERPMAVNAMAPFRQMGLSVEGTVGRGLLHYSAGVYNGFERHTNFHEGHTESPSALGNRVDQLAYAGRVSLQPMGSTGSEMADLDGGKLRVGIGTSYYHNDGTTTRASGWETDLLLKAGGFHLAVEYLTDTAEPTQQPDDPETLPTRLDRMCLVGELGVMILPSRLGLTLRGEWLDDDTELENEGDAVVMAGGLQYYWHRHHLKAQLDYTHRKELHGVARDNDTLLLQLQFRL